MRSDASRHAPPLGPPPRLLQAALRVSGGLVIGLWLLHLGLHRQIDQALQYAPRGDQVFSVWIALEAMQCFGVAAGAAALISLGALLGRWTLAPMASWVALVPTILLLLCMMR